MLAILFAFTILGTILFVLQRRYRSTTSTTPAAREIKQDHSSETPATEIKKPLSVNYHFSRVCNYACKFCFHTNTNNFNLPLEEAKRGIKLLHEAGTKKINFAGGEPFLFPKDLGEMCKYSKELGMAVSIVSNGSKIQESWFRSWGQYLDILAISCDSFDEKTNEQIGRGKGKHVEQVYKVAEWCRKYGIKFKLNSVICCFNHEEDMNAHIQALAPFRWKVFQVLLIDGENIGYKTEKDAEHLLITKQQFDAFTARHSSQQSLVAESNELMKDSYLILDERMRFLNCQNGKKEPSRSILDVPVEAALAESGFDGESFLQRKGIYDWTRDVAAQPACAAGPIDW